MIRFAKRAAIRRKTSDKETNKACKTCMLEKPGTLLNVSISIVVQTIALVSKDTNKTLNMSGKPKYERIILYIPKIQNAVILKKIIAKPIYIKEMFKEEKPINAEIRYIVPIIIKSANKRNDSLSSSGSLFLFSFIKYVPYSEALNNFTTNQIFEQTQDCILNAFKNTFYIRQSFFFILAHYFISIALDNTIMLKSFENS